MGSWTSVLALVLGQDHGCWEYWSNKEAQRLSVVQECKPFLPPGHWPLRVGGHWLGNLWEQLCMLYVH